MLTFRKMSIEDYENIYTLWLSCKGMGLNDIDDSKEGISKYLSRNPDTCFVAICDKMIVGVILSGHDGRRGFIHHTAVNPNYRNMGIASSLLDFALNALKEQGISKIALVCFKRNETGNCFWEKQGFTSRDDLVYRNKALVELKRIDT